VLRHRSGSWLLLLLVAAMTFALWPASAFAHSERPTKAPDGTGTVPVYRTTGPHLVVCKSDTADFTNRIGAFATDLRIRNLELFAECLDHGYRDLQAAVDHVTDAGTTIYVLPGIYLEEPSLAPESDACNHLAAPRAKAGYQILSYEQQKSCPHQQNLVGIFGIKDLQIEGTGAAPADVVFDAQFQKLNVIRGDRTNGLYLRNFIAQRSTFNAVYVIETDGFVIDNMIGRWNTEYGFLAFASDHGLITKCEAYGNGDSGVYPGGTSDINRDRGYNVPRYAIEVTGCHSHDNLLGYSGTGGDSVWVHDNEFDHNTGGASMDSLFPNHPGLPQNHALFEHNLIHSNNSNYYSYITEGSRSAPESWSSAATTTSFGTTTSTTTGRSASCRPGFRASPGTTPIGRRKARRRTTTVTSATSWVRAPLDRVSPTGSTTSGTARARATAGRPRPRTWCSRRLFRAAQPRIQWAPRAGLSA